MSHAAAAFFVFCWLDYFHIAGALLLLLKLLHISIKIFETQQHLRQLLAELQQMQSFLQVLDG